MDREVKEQYQVLIQAKDMGGQLGGLAGTTTVNITLSDVNDNPPRFSKSKHYNFQFHSNLGSKVYRGDNLNLGNGFSSCLLDGVGFHYFSANTTTCLFSRIESRATIPTNKLVVVLPGHPSIFRPGLSWWWCCTRDWLGVFKNCILSGILYKLLNQINLIVPIIRSRKKPPWEKEKKLVLQTHWSLKTYLCIPSINIKVDAK